MGPSQSAQLHNPPTLKDVFPSITQYKPIKAKPNNSHLYQQGMYKHQVTGKTAIVRTFDISGSNKNSVQNYYLARSKIKGNPHVLQLFDMKLILNKSNNKISEEATSSSLCSVPSFKYQNSQSYQFWLLLQSSTITLQDEILNRVNKRSFQEIQLWSVLSSCVLGSLNLLEQGCKQPVLSPKGIGLTQDGVVKVGEWQFVSKINQKNVAEDGQVLFGKYGESISQLNRNSLNQILLNYYWAPEGLKAMQSFMALGKKQSKLTAVSHRIASQKNYQKFQIFSLGMTLISMCLRNCYYRTDTFSQKYLNKLTHQAIQIRKIEGKQLSPQIKHLIESMVKWDPSERISYIELRDQVLQYFNDHPQEMKNSSVTMKTFDNMSINDTINIHNIKSRNNSQSSNLSMNLTEESFMNSITFQKGFKFNRKKNNVKSQQIMSVKSLNDSYQGSGMVQQGTGDDDQHLQIQKQQQKETNDAKSHSQHISNNPITHRTQKQLHEEVCEIKKDNSPYLKLNEINQNICPNSTPYVQNSPNIHTNFDVTSKEQTIGHRKNQKYLNIPNQQEKQKQKEKQKEKYKNMNNQLYKPQSFKISLNNLKIETNFNQNISFRPQLHSNRGSYRSSSKQPPKLNSARNCNQNKVTQFGYQLYKPLISNQTYKQIENMNLNMNKLQNTHKIEYQIKNRLLPTQKLEPDNQDRAQSSLKHSNIFANSQIEQQIENPDIFQTFQQLESVYESDRKQLELSNHLKPLTKLKQIPQTKSIITKDHQQQKINISNPNDNMQFATFNQMDKGIEDSFAKIKIDSGPSKWKKSENVRKSREIFNKDESLFTDPKLLEYIKSPIKPPNHYQFDNTSKFNTKQFMDIINQQKIVQSISFPSLIQNKQNLNIDNTQQNDEKIFKNYLQRNSSKDNLIKNKFQNQMQFIDHYSENTKIVKEKVSRGFYQGEKKNGLRSGYGVFYYNQGGKYKGNWLNNQMHGKGTLQYADGRIAYQGDWHCDELHGKGVLYNQSPNFVTEGLNYKDFDELDQTWIFYEGNFEHDDKSGIGLLVLSNQEQFIGQFKNDMAEGLGQYLKVDGKVIKGIWHRNKLVKVYQE